MKYTLLTMTAATLVASGSTLRIIAQNEFAGFSRNSLTNMDGSATLTTGDFVVLGYFETADGPAADGDSFDGFVELDSVLLNLGVQGEFSQTIDLNDAADLPDTTSQTVQFGIRFYDGPTVADSSFYNTVTTENWVFSFSPDGTVPPPTDSEMFLDPIAGGPTIASAVWEGGSTSAFSTTVPVPEPSAAISALLGAALLLRSRRR